MIFFLEVISKYIYIERLIIREFDILKVWLNDGMNRLNFLKFISSLGKYGKLIGDYKRFNIDIGFRKLR